MTTGFENTAIGADALRRLISGNDNVAIGDDAGCTTGNYNTFIGSEAAVQLWGNGPGIAM